MPVDLASLIRASITERRQALDQLEVALDTFERVTARPAPNGIRPKPARRGQRRRKVEGSVEERIVTAVREGATTMPAIVKAANVRAYDAKKYVRALVADGQLVKVGNSRGTKYEVSPR